MDDLSKYLEGQRQAGRVESCGEFTLALEKARKKLQHYQLADASFYLLKVFQAAVAAGALRVDIQTTRNSLTLCFGCQSPPFSLVDLLNGLQNTLGLPPSALRHLAIGLNSSLVMDPLQVLWLEWGPQESRALSIQGTEVGLVEAPTRPQKATGEPFLYMFQVTKRLTSWFRSSVADEHSALYQRCGYAPVDVFLDGRPLRTRWATQQEITWHQQWSKPFYLVERVEPAKHGAIRHQMPDLRGYRPEGDAWLRPDRRPETFCVQAPGLTVAPKVVSTLDCRGAFAIPLTLEGSSTVTFIRDGVLIESRTVERRGGGAVALLPGNDLTLDLSEFKIKEDEAYFQAIGRVRNTWLDMLKAVSPHRDKLQGTLTPEETREESQRTGQAGCCGCLASILGFMVLGASGFGDMAMVGAGVTGLLGLASPYLLARREDRHAELKSGVRQRIAELRRTYGEN